MTGDAIVLRALTDADVDAHNAGEDEETIRWLTGEPGTVDTTRRHFARLAQNAARGRGARGFGVWLDGRLAGFVEYDPDNGDLPRQGDVNVSYAVHPWARRRGVAAAAVELLCARLTAGGVARRAVIRTEPANVGSVGVARRCGFGLCGVQESATDRHPDGTAVRYAVYARKLR
ncbi:GNAT family N-acetyltransferase [Microbacterium sp.]|uniref:GNAT family N-acetyltransferase n=1 Tax=Microbacterium sp. TaxID=51671 RepID=UPI003A88FDAC